MEASERYFRNEKCPYFPCHAGVAAERFNCLFCYCPLYALGKNCGGSPLYTETGVKDCSRCVFPHQAENYDALLARWQDIAAVVRREDGAAVDASPSGMIE